MEGQNIHKTAVVNPNARLSSGVTIGAYSIIGFDVTLGDNVKIGSHCVVDGQTTIGKNCQLYTGAVIGSPPQDKKHNGNSNVYLTIGENNIIREYVTINTGTVEGGGKTTIGSNNLLMAYAHVAHDCVIGNNCVMANVGGCSKVVQDVPPFSMCDGHPAKVYNLNLIGLRRAKISAKAVNLLKKAFKMLFFSGLSKTNAIAKIEQEVELCPEVEHLVFFAKTTVRGLCS